MLDLNEHETIGDQKILRQTSQKCARAFIFRNSYYNSVKSADIHLDGECGQIIAFVFTACINICKETHAA